MPSVQIYLNKELYELISERPSYIVQEALKEYFRLNKEKPNNSTR